MAGHPLCFLIREILKSVVKFRFWFPAPLASGQARYPPLLNAYKNIQFHY